MDFNELQTHADFKLIDSTPSTSSLESLIAGASSSAAPRQSSHGRHAFTLTDPPATQSAPTHAYCEHKIVWPTTPQTQKSTMPTWPIVQLDENTLRNAGIEFVTLGMYSCYN